MTAYDTCIRPETTSLDLAHSHLIGFHGVRVIPDVHGCFETFVERLEEAERSRLFVIQLGDLIDRGPDSPLCMEAMLDVEQRGLGIMILGNHEWAFFQFLRNGSKPAVTRQATYMLFERHGANLLKRFSARIGHGPLWVRTPRHLFVHAAFHPRMMDGINGAVRQNVQQVSGGSAPAPNATDKDLMIRALLGEWEIGPGGKRRCHKWIDAVPRGLTVIVGHEVIEEGCIISREGRAGGKVIFADTGSWRFPGSSLAFIDIPIENL